METPSPAATAASFLSSLPAAALRSLQVSRVVAAEAVPAGQKIFTPYNVAVLFGVDRAQVSSIHVLPEGLAIKLTLLRPRPQCSAGETDVYGCQQHVPLMTLPVPLEGNYSPPADSAAVQS